MVRRRRQVQQEEEQRVDHRPRHDDDAINDESECREEYKINDGYIFSDPKLESWGGKGATIKEARMFQLARNG